MIPDSSIKVLIVEDEREIRLTLVQMFELEGLKVDSACSGNSGFELASAKKYACIVSDLKMSDGTGLEMLKKLRIYNIKTPILFFTGFADDELKEILEEENTIIFNKPGEITELINEVKKRYLFVQT